MVTDKYNMKAVRAKDNNDEIYRFIK